MIIRRLAAFFTLIAFVCFSGTWLVRNGLGYPTPDITSMFSQGLVVIFAYFLIGIFLARMGVALVKEVLENKHQKEEDKRERARNLYLTAISSGKTLLSTKSGGDMDVSTAAKGSVGAGGDESDI